MAFVTRLTLQSGDRATLDAVVGEITALCERKGAELKGPHPQPPDTLRVARHKRLVGDGDTFEPWSYTVYARTIEIVGHDSVARQVAERSFPPGVHVEADVEQVRSMGNG